MKSFLSKAFAVVLCAILCTPVSAYAEASENVQTTQDSKGALVEGASFSLSEFSRLQKGSNKELDGEYHGYAYLTGSEVGKAIQLLLVNNKAVVYVPKTAADILELDISNTVSLNQLTACILKLDELNSAGGSKMSDTTKMTFTQEKRYVQDGVAYLFDQEIAGQVYCCVIGENGEDVTGEDVTNTNSSISAKPTFCDTATLSRADAITIGAEKTWVDEAGEFLANLDWSPLWVTLKTTAVAIVIVFILGLLAAYWALNMGERLRSILDSIFTIPMVLPPTVCGFVLLFLCGRNTAFGRFFIDIGFPLIFSWPATVIAAVVVAFPLMYRSALGAFQNLDPNLLNSARTLGWSNKRIFVKLMLPLSWSSIAAGTVLAFARALGEFGATLFLAGNYVGITRTIPIAIYFEWMNGNNDTAWFWTAIVIAVSFLVILFINIWSNRTVKYRKASD